ncbi:MAG: glycosyltransferase family 2 protein [Nostocaceae cyanobacterium]|nr:glycosyltransferase family 2 protein [Nostocaceae cyanobacterium]
MNIKVSILITAYNCEKYIYKAIESALAQTEKQIEVIVINDASTDNTLKIAQSFNDERLKVFTNPQNFGQSYSLNFAAKEAKGEWIVSLDSDDWYAPDRIEKLLYLALSENADMCADNMYLICDGDEQPWSTFLNQSKVRIDKVQHIDTKFFIENDLPGTWSFPLGLTKPLIKRDLIINNQIENKLNFKFSRDFWFYFECLAHGAKFVFTPEPYYYYRSRVGSMVTSSQVEQLSDQCQATKYFLQLSYVKNNPQLVNSLTWRLNLMERTIPYLRVIDPLKKGKILDIILKMVQNPYFFWHLINQLPRIIWRRLSYLSSASLFKSMKYTIHNNSTNQK